MTVLADLQYRLLRKLAPGEPTHMDGRAFQGRSKLATLLGDTFLDEVKDRDVLDFGCGEGAESVEVAQHGARVFGLDIRESVLSVARKRAVEAGVTDRCQFGTKTDGQYDIVLSVDAFEHFADPAAALVVMHRLLRPGGFVAVTFGPTWFHPYGGHLFSVFPWAHLVLAEESLIRWRSHFRQDGATRFNEVEGGLNRMTIRRFERLVANSAFAVETIQLVPIRRLKPLHTALTREFTTAIVRARLRKAATGS